MPDVTGQDRRNQLDNGIVRNHDAVRCPVTSLHAIDRRCRLRSAFQTCIGAVFVGLVTAVFAISFAAIIYANDLSNYLDRGIGLTLLGSVILAIIGVFSLSFRGSILSAQDVPALFLATAAATSIANFELSGEEAFATTAGLVAVASVATGLAGFLIGRMKLAYVARFVPYPVLAGFLSATGLLLLLGGFGIAVGDQDDNIKMSGMLSLALTPKWGLPLLASVLILIATHVIKNQFVLPIAFIITALAHYVMFWLLGMSMEDARALGYLLGPFDQSGFLSKIDFATVSHANWGAIFSQTPVIVTIVFSALIGATLNASGLELAFRRDLEVNREIRGVGIANVISGLLGGMPGYHSLSGTVLAHKLGLSGAVVGLSGGVGCALVLLVGANVLSILPVGLFAAVIIFLGLDLLYTWLYEERRRLNHFDYSIVILMTFFAVTYSFMTAIVIGLLACSIFFIYSYAKLNLIKSQSNLSTRRSLVERPDHERCVIDAAGHRVQIVELSGFLFFGTAYALRENIRTLVIESSEHIDWLVLDFKHVSGVDVSTLRILQRISSELLDERIQLILTGIEGRSGTHLQDLNAVENTTDFKTLNDAIEHIEEHVLQERMDELSEVADSDVTFLERLVAENKVSKFVEDVFLNDGETLLESGIQSENIYLLRSGELRVFLPAKHQLPTLVARIRPDAVVGEMAYYSGGKRSASIVSDGKSRLLKIDMNFLTHIEEARPGSAALFHKLVARNLARRLQRTTRLLQEQGS